MLASNRAGLQASHARNSMIGGSYLLFSLLLLTLQPASSQLCSFHGACCPFRGRVDRTCLSSLIPGHTQVTPIALPQPGVNLASPSHWENPLKIFNHLLSYCGISNTLWCSINAASWVNALLFMSLDDIEPLIQSSLQNYGHYTLFVIRLCPRDLWTKVNLSQMSCFRTLSIKIHNWLSP